MKKNKVFTLKLVHRFLIPTLVLSFLVVSLGVIFVHQKWENKNSNDKTYLSVEYSKVVSSLVHELQKERGLSAGFLGQGKDSSEFLQHLKQQRLSSESALEAFNRSFKKGDNHFQNTFTHEVAQSILTALNQLDNLSKIRQQIDAVGIKPLESTTYFSQTIASLQHIAFSMSRITESVEISDRFISYLAIGQAKEWAGIERATGAGAFSAGEFSDAALHRFIDVISIQNSHFNVFKERAASADLNYFKSVMSNPITKEIERLRKIAFESPKDLRGITGPYWFEVATKRIDLLKGLEDEVGKNLQNIAQQHKDEAIQELSAVLAIVSLATLGSVGLALYFGFGTSRSITNVCQVMVELAKGELDLQVPYVNRSDEIGHMAKSLQVFKQNLEENRRLSAEQEEMKQALEDEKQQQNYKVAAQMTLVKNQGMSSVLEGTDHLRTWSSEMKDQAAMGSSQADAASEAAQSAHMNVMVVSSAATQLAASIHEITSQVTNVRDLVNGAVAEMEESEHKTNNLQALAVQIGEIVKVIHAISKQTNLLALNATIEAARAGESGKGFAVVAQEVKSLSSQVANASDQIAQIVVSIQHGAIEAVSSLQKTKVSVETINSAVAAVAAAVEEQHASTEEIARSVNHAAESVKISTHAIQEVARGTAITQDLAEKVGCAASDLESQVINMGDTLENGIRQTTGERRTSIRVDLSESNIYVTIQENGGSKKVKVLDLSATGILLQGKLSSSHLRFSFPDSNDLVSGRMIRCDDHETAVEFNNLSQEQTEQVKLLMMSTTRTKTATIYPFRGRKVA